MPKTKQAATNTLSDADQAELLKLPLHTSVASVPARVNSQIVTGTSRVGSHTRQSLFSVDLSAKKTESRADAIGGPMRRGAHALDPLSPTLPC